MVTDILNKSLWYYILVSGALYFYTNTPIFAQEDSTAYYRNQLEKSADIAFENPEFQDSCIGVYKKFFQYSLKKDQTTQGIKHIRDGFGKFFRAKEYFLVSRLVDSIGSWVKPQLLNESCREDLAFLYIFKGYGYMQSNNHLSAIDAYEEALERYQFKFSPLCDDQDLGKCLLNEGKYANYDHLWRFIHFPLIKLYKKMGDYDVAKSYLPNKEEMEIIRTNQVLNEEEIATIYIELVGCAFADRDTVQAYLLSKQSSELYKEDSQEKYETLINLALIERTLHKFEDAYRNLNRIIKYAENDISEDATSNRLWRDGHLFKGYTYRDEALAYMDIDPGKAKQLFEQARNEYDLLLDFMSQNPGEYQKELIHLLHSKGDIEFFDKEYAQADRYYQEALSITSQGTQSPNLPSSDSLLLDFDLFYTLEGLGKIWHQQYSSSKDVALLDRASEAYSLVFALEDSFRVRYPTEATRQIQQTNSQKRLKTRMNIAFDLWEEKKDAASIEMALNIMDRSRALEMQAHLRGNSLEKDLSKSHQKLIDTISAIQESVYQLYLETPEQEDIQAHKKLIQQTNDELMAYRKKLKKDNPAYYRLKFTPQTSSVRELQNKLTKNEALINYFWEGNFLYKLLISRENYNLERQPINDELIEQLRFLTIFIQNQRPTKGDQLTYQETAYVLYEKLLGGLSPNLEELIIVPDGALNHLAFEALLTEKVDTNKTVDYRQLRYVLQKYLIRYQYVPHFLLQEEKIVQADDKPPMLYAGFAPTYDFSFAAESGRAALGNLEFNIHEIDSVFQLFSTFSSNNQRFLDSDAREEKFREIAPQAELIHIAMHAISADDSFQDYLTEQPYLLFSNQRGSGSYDDRLYMQEIYGLDLQAEMMVLSACNTGTGRWAAGEGMLSLGRAFRMAGCNNIISSLWNVNDESSQKVIQSFFGFLKQGDGKAEALRKAKEAYLFHPQIRNSKAAPYYWAQFVLMGDNTQLAALKSSNQTSYFMMLGVFVLLILAGVGFYSRRGNRG